MSNKNLKKSKNKPQPLKQTQRIKIKLIKVVTKRIIVTYFLNILPILKANNNQKITYGSKTSNSLQISNYMEVEIMETKKKKIKEE